MSKAPVASFAAFADSCKIIRDVRGGRLRPCAGEHADLLEYDCFPSEMSLLRTLVECADRRPRRRAVAKPTASRPHANRSYITDHSEPNSEAQSVRRQAEGLADRMLGHDWRERKDSIPESHVKNFISELIKIRGLNVLGLERFGLVRTRIVGEGPQCAGYLVVEPIE
jgi:hypothetical protein